MGLTNLRPKLVFSIWGWESVESHLYALLYTISHKELQHPWIWVANEVLEPIARGHQETPVLPATYLMLSNLR